VFASKCLFAEWFCPMRFSVGSLPCRVFVFLAVVALCCGAGARAQGFGAPVVVPAASQPIAVYAADVNGDGIPDLVYIVVDPNTDTTVHMLLGDSKGGFTESASLVTAVPSIGLGNLLGTGHIDIGLVASQTFPSRASADVTVEIFGGSGTGTFANDGNTSGEFSVPAPNTVAYGYAQAVRLQPSGPLNFIAEDVDNNTILTFQAGGATFTTTSGYTHNASIPILDGAGPMAVADLNGDGKPDLVVNGQSGYSASVYLGNGDGTFQAPAKYSFGHRVHSLLLVDVDRDGHPDMVVEGDNGIIEVFHGNPDATFGSSSIGGTMSVDDTKGDGGHLIVAADLNGDGIQDLLTYTPLGVSVELGTASGNYTLQGVYPAGTGAGTNGQFATADFNGDGLLDVAMDTPGGIAILYGQGAAAGTGCPTPVAGTVVACAEPSAFEGAFTLTATIVPSSTGSAATGTVTFSIAGTTTAQTPLTTLGTATVVNGVATLAVSGTPLTSTTGVPAPIIPGQYTVKGDYFAKNSALAVELPGTHTINLGPTTVTLTPAPPTVTLGPTFFYGQGINGYVSFGVLDAAQYPTTGSWTQLSNGVPVPGCIDLPFYVNGVPVASSCPYGYPQLLDSGTYVFTEAYNGGPMNGDPVNASGMSAPYAFAVIPDTTAVSSLTSSLNPATYGMAVTFTATLTGNAATPTGQVSFLDGANLLGVGTLNASGQASFATSSLTVGTHPITAAYAATQNFNAASSAALQQVIELAPLVSAVVLQSSLNPSLQGQTVTFTATVSVPGPFVRLIQSGTVSFLDGGTVIGTGTINKLGVATFSTATLALGSHAITASYGGATSGSQAIQPSVSAVLTQVVTVSIGEAPPGFTLRVSPNPARVPAGQTAILLVTVQALSGFAEPVTLSCAGLPGESTCMFIEATIPAGGGATTLELATTAPHNCGDPTHPYAKPGGLAAACTGGSRLWASARERRGLEFGGPLLAGLILLLPRRRRWLRGRGVLVAVALLAGLVGLSGCGGNCTDLGTYPGAYTVTVTGTAQGATALTQSVAVPLTVQVP
jgi:hypothetical protein